MLRGTSREAAAELLGTFVLIVFGVGVVAQTVLSAGSNGSYLGINLGWGLAVMLGVYVAGGVSGAHLNPAVTIALAITRGFPWSKVAPFVLAQLAGAVLASLVVYVTYVEALTAFDGGVRQVLGERATAGIFATYPQPFLTTVGGFVDQVVGTALLMATILAITDQRNNPTPAWLTPIVVGGIVVAIGVAFGFNAGYAINPARDLGPRLFTAIAGWGSGVFTAAGNWWWVPVVAPCVGAVLGAVAYDWLIGKHHPPIAAMVDTRLAAVDAPPTTAAVTHPPSTSTASSPVEVA
jgi:MIP family channel proteins